MKQSTAKQDFLHDSYRHSRGQSFASHSDKKPDTEVEITVRHSVAQGDGGPLHHE
jgi:hypothetical protein